MNLTNPKALYAVEPQGERFARWVAETTRWAVRLYWELFVTLPVLFITMGLALMCLIVGLFDIVKNPGNAIKDMPLICASATFLVFQRVRAFVWAFLACSTVWFLLVVAILVPLLGEDYRPTSTAANIGICLLDLLPPLITSLFIDYARHRKTES